MSTPVKGIPLKKAAAGGGARGVGVGGVGGGGGGGQERVADEAQRFLRHHPTPGATVQGLGEVLEACERRALGPRDALCREGDAADALYFVIAGGIEVRKIGRDGADRRLGSVAGPCLLGQVALLDRTPRTATCIVESPALVLALPAAAFDRLVSEPSAAGVTLRRLVLTSLSRQLVTGHTRLGHLAAALGRAVGVRPRGKPAAKAAPPSWAGLEDELTEVEVVYGGRRQG